MLLFISGCSLHRFKLNSAVTRFECLHSTKFVPINSFYMLIFNNDSRQKRANAASSMVFKLMPLKKMKYNRSFEDNVCTNE